MGVEGMRCAPASWYSINAFWNYLFWGYHNVRNHASDRITPR